VDKRFYNHYSLWNIPLSINYSRSTQNWNLGIEAGINFNLKTTSEGRYFLNEAEDEDLSKITETKMGLSYQFGLLVERQITDNFSISLNPRVIRFSKDFTKNSVAPFSKNYMLYGADLRLKYTF